MILTKNNELETEISGNVETIKGGMGGDSLSLLIDMVGNQMYSNPIGSIIREMTSNCFDAHIEWEKVKGTSIEDAVLVKYSEEEGIGFISFIDKGIGLSPQRVQDIYMKLLTSSKRTSDDFIGGFGLGSKSFLSYTDSINLITRHEGIEYYYIIGKNEDGGFDAHLLEEKSTEEHNGTEVKMAIGSYGFYSKPDDWRHFRQQIREQLYYFDNVWVEGFDLENDYQLFETDSFKYRTGWSNPFKEMHIVLGKVVYPIDWKALQIEQIDLPVGVKFDIGELYVTINRESIRYKEESKKLIKERIELVIEDIRRLYNKNSKEVETLEEYYEKVNSPMKYLSFLNNEGEETKLYLPYKQALSKDRSEYINVDVIEGLQNVKYKPFAHLPITIPKDPFFMFIFRGRMTKCDRGDAIIEGLAEKFEKDVYLGVKHFKDSIFRTKDFSTRTKPIDKFIFWKENERHQYPVFLSIRKSLSLATWEKELGLGEKTNVNVNYKVATTASQTIVDGEGEIQYLEVPIFEYQKKKRVIISPVIQENSKFSNKTQIIREFKRLMLKEIIARTQSYEKQVPTPQYLSHLELLKIQNKRPKLEGKIATYNILNSQSEQLDLASLEKFTGFIIYGERTQAKEVRLIMRMLLSDNHRTGYNSKPKKIYKFFTTGKTNFDKLQNPYYMSVEQFMEGHNRLFKNAVSAWYIKDILYKIRSKVGYDFSEKVKDYNKKIAEERNELHKWSQNKYNSSYVDEQFMKSCLEIGLANNLLDNDRIDRANKLKEWFEGLGHFRDISNIQLINEEFQKDLVVILKYRKKRLSPEHYNPGPSLFEIARRAREKPKRLALPRYTSITLSQMNIKATPIFEVEEITEEEIDELELDLD